MAGRISSSPDAAATRETVLVETKSARVSQSGSPSEGAKFSQSGRPSSKRTTSPADRLAKLEAIVRGEHALDRNRALLAYIDQLGPADFEGAVAHFRALGITDERMGEYSLLLAAWAQADPTSALTYAGKNTRNGFARDTILTTWATNDPDAAIRWAQSNHDGDGANPYMAGIIRGLAASDPAKATELLASMPRSVERGNGLDFLLPTLLKQGAEATQRWISALSDDSLRDGAIMRATGELASADPAGTAAWLLNYPGEAQQRRMDDVYRIWAGKDQGAALSSFVQMPAGDNRSNALRGMVSNMASADPKAAVGLMDQYPSDVTDRVVQHFVWHSFGNDPAVAASQIGRITDEGQRNAMYSRVLESWSEDEPDKASAWIQANPLPDAVRNELARRQQRNR